MERQTKAERATSRRVARDAAVLQAGIICALANNYRDITRDDVAEIVGCAPSTVSLAYGTMRKLRRAVLTAAVEREILPIIAQGLADGHEIVRSIPPDLKERVRAAL